MFSQINIDLLFAYLITDTAKQIFEDNSRQYGNGLQKFEPNDLNNGMMLDLGLLDIHTQKIILELYNEYRNITLNNQHNKNIINQIDKILTKKYCF